MGFSITKYAKDYKGLKYVRHGDGSNGAFGKNRRLNYLAKISQLGFDRTGTCRRISGTNRARENILVMAEALIKVYLGPETTLAKLSSLDTLQIFKNAAEKDEYSFDFNVMDLYLRCVKLLDSIQAHCLAHAPLDYADKLFRTDLGMNTVIYRILHDLDGSPQHNAPMFPDAVDILRKVIEEEGNAVLAQAGARQHLQ
ncbi:hypothetical protein BKA66DRAFT_531593 [Pyrenochaeta sp. MPI-SDFR-AT-0127]|nr:hypothetical protein BKA66DRAFT_531593 [Pyrenochaeta sp. MPI-SDFR-AT-0127]